MIPPWFSEENQVDPPSFWCGGIIVLAALTWSRRTESHQSLPEIAELKITDNSGSTPATPPGFSCPIAPVRADGVTQRARRATGDEFADGSLKALRRPQSALRQMSPSRRKIQFPIRNRRACFWLARPTIPVPSAGQQPPRAAAHRVRSHSVRLVLAVAERLPALRFVLPARFAREGAGFPHARRAV